MHVVKGQSTNQKSLKIQNFLGPGNQILAYKTMLWVFVVRTSAWCSHILQMWSIHTGEQREQTKNRTTAKIQTAKIALHFTEQPLTTVVTLHMLSPEAVRSFYSPRNSWSALPWKYEPGQNRIRTFLKTPVVFSGFSLLILKRTSLAVFAGVQDVVHLVFKWAAALLVHHFVLSGSAL